MGGGRAIDAPQIARERRADWPGASFLAQLDAPVLHDFLTAGELVRFRKGKILLSENDATTDAFLLLDSYVKVTTQLDSGGQALLAIRVGGDVVGEIASMDGGDHTATVSACAHEPVVAVRLGRDDLLSLLSQHPAAAISLTSAVSRKLRSATRRRIDITNCTAQGRMARVVLELAEDYGHEDYGHSAARGVLISVNLTQMELGTLIGVGETTAQRALRGLREEGLVENFGRLLLVPDMAALRAAAWPSPPKPVFLPSLCCRCRGNGMLAAEPLLPRRFTVVTRSSAVPVRRIITVSDAEGYSKRRDDDQRDLQNWMAEIENRAAVNAGLNRRRAIVQGRGDGNLVAWPPGITDLELVANYLRELNRELNRVNKNLRKNCRIRMRFAVTSGIVEEAAQGIPGHAAIRATVLVDSDELRETLRKANSHALAVIIDDSMYEDVVKTRRLGLQPEKYRKVVVKGKNDAAYTAWITVPGATRQPVPDSSRGDADRPRDGQPNSGGKKRRGWTLPITVALIGAVATIAAATITAMADGNSGASKTLGSTSSDASAPPSTSASATASPTGSSGKFYSEETDNHLGTDVFRDPMGDAVISGPISIPFGTYVRVKCWAPNESGMGSINAFYLIETSPWAGEYAPANTFLNADTSGSLDPHVPECPAT
jgi:CRP/FNR family transcriptional regulator, cyclic AMP receptor protein